MSTEASWFHVFDSTRSLWLQDEDHEFGSNNPLNLCPHGLVDGNGDCCASCYEDSYGKPPSNLVTP